MEYLIVGVAFVLAVIYCSRPCQCSTKSRGTLNEACPNEGTGDFAYKPDDHIETEK